jgi:hypothetical protein
VIGAPFLNRGYSYGFASSVGHPRLDSVELLIYDGMRIYPRHWCYITGLSGQGQPCWEMVNIMGKPYKTNYEIYIYKIYFSIDFLLH